MSENQDNIRRRPTNVDEAIRLLTERALYMDDRADEFDTKFSNLTTKLEALADAQIRTEDALARFTRHTNEAFAHLAGSQSRTDEVLDRMAEAQQRTDTAVTRLAESQHRTDEALTHLAGSQHRMDKTLTRLAESQHRTDEVMGRLAEAQHRTDEALTRLAESQAHSDRRLDALIDIVQNWRNGGGGGTAPNA